MSSNLPDELREYIRTQNKELADRADNFWKIATPIFARQSNPNSNENGYPHIEMVEHNAWRLIRGAGKVADFDPYELFILSCAVCSHDFDKGLFDKLLIDLEHGKGSGDFLINHYKELQKSFPEAVAIKKIIGLHDLPDGRFQEELKNIEKSFPLSKGPVKLQMLAVILKTADILHTDNSRIASIGIDTSSMNQKEKNKQLARESITGWEVDGSRIIINAVPETHDHLSALDGCMNYIKEKEWPAVAEKLQDYGFPYNLVFKIDTSICEEPTELNEKALDKPGHVGDKYSQDNYVFNIPYREKGEGVVGRENALQQLHTQLTESRGTAIGQTASFHGMGGLGKTQLAVEYAYRYKDDYSNGVIWISADQEIDPQLIQIAKKCNWIAPESEHKLILDIAKRRLRIYSDCLIIFDNVDKLADIEPYLPEPDATPHLILTSRKPQPGFQPIEIDILNEKESQDLLMMESGRSFDSLPLDEKNAGKNIAIELGGLPLALEIAGAYLRYLSSLSFEKYLSILKEKPSAALPGEMLSSFTSHESDLYRTLKVSESVFEQVPLLKDILNVLTWSGSSFMGISLLAVILDVDENSLIQPLSFGVELRILRKNEAHDRYEIHRLLRKVRQEEFALEKNREWAENICKRNGSWFEKRRKDFAHLAEYEFEIDHLKQWYKNSEKIQSNQNSRLLWLQAYPSYHWGNYTETFELVKLALDLYEKSPAESIELKANILNDIGTVHGFIGDYQKALEFKERALEIRKKLLGPEHPDTATSLDNVGTTYAYLGDPKKALELHERALEIREKLLEPENPDRANSLNSVGSAYGELDDHKKALVFKERALEICEKQLGPEHPDTASSLSNVGSMYGVLGDYKKALEFKERALEIMKKKLGSEHPHTAASLNNVGATYGDLGKYKKALEFMEHALEIRENQLGLEHPDTATSLNNVGSMYGELGDYKKALEFKERALDISKKQLGPEHPDTASSLSNVGSTYGVLGNHKKALEFKKRALEILAKKLGPEHPQTVGSLDNVGSTYGELGDHKKALQYQERALDILKKQLGPGHPDTASSLSNVGSTYGELSDHKKALEFKEHALEIRHNQLGPEHPITATSLNNVGGTYGDLGDHKKALEFKERALEIMEKQLGPEHPNTTNSLNNVIFAFLKVRKFSDAYNLLNRYLKVLPKDHPEYNVLFSLNDRINSESIKSGFRPRYSKKSHKKKKKRKR